MYDLLLSLAVGVGLIIVANLLLVRISSLGATRSAVLVALASLGIYVPIAIFYWPGSDVLAMHLAIYLVTACACGLFMGARETAGAKGRSGGLRFHWGPAAIAGFFVGLVGLFALFILLAGQGLSPRLSSRLLPSAQGTITSVFPGTISHDFQQKEDLYNDYLLQVERQQERGWQVQKGWLQKPVKGQPAEFKVMARTHEGDPLRGAEVTGWFLRPSDSRLDVRFSMQEVEPGAYQAGLNLPAAGVWNLVLQLRKRGDLHEIRASTSVLTP